MVLTGIRIYPMQPVMQEPIISRTYGAGFRQGVIPFGRPPFHFTERPAAEGDEGLAGEVMHALAPVPFAPVPPCHYSSLCTVCVAAGVFWVSDTNRFTASPYFVPKNVQCGQSLTSNNRIQPLVHLIGLNGNTRQIIGLSSMSRAQPTSGSNNGQLSRIFHQPSITGSNSISGCVSRIRSFSCVITCG